MMLPGGRYSWSLALVLLVASGTETVRAGNVVAWSTNPYGGGPPVPVAASNVVLLAGGYSQSLALRSNGTLTAWGYVALPGGLSNIVHMASGDTFALAVKDNGTVTGWGSEVYYGETTIPAGLLEVTAVGAGFNHVVALKADGTVQSWGCGFSGQCFWPVDTNFVAISVGGYHSLGLRADHTVVRWSFGEVDAKPVVSNVVAIAAGGYHDLLLFQDGTVEVWGDPGVYDYGQTNLLPGISNVVGVAAGIYHNVLLKKDGTVQAWGYNYYAQCNVPVTLTNAIAVAAGAFHSLALTGTPNNAPGPAIVRQPTAAPVLNGSRALLSVGVMGATPLSYQWRRDGIAIPGATNDYLELTVTTNQVGAYSVLVSNAAGTNLSSSAAVSVFILPQVTQVSSGTVAPVGSNVALHAEAIGLPPPALQWLRNGSAVSGQTNQDLTLTNVQISQAGNYSLRATNYAGSVVSANIAIMVDSPPGFTKQPTNSAVYVGEPVTFRTTATGTAPLSYQWRYNSTNIPGAISNSFTIPAVSLNQAGDYSVLVTSPFFATNSTNAFLTVLDGLPLLQAAPTNTPIFPGGSIALSATFSGSKPQTYQWFFNSNVVPTGTNLTLSLTGVRSNQTGWYAVAASNSWGGLLSPAAFVSLIDVACWGDVGDRQTITRPNPLNPPPASLTNLVAVAGGRFYALVLRADGTVQGWGDGSSGQTNVPNGLTNVVAIASGNSHFLALRADGTVAGWGFNTSGQAAVPADLSNVVAIAGGAAHSLALLHDGTVRAWGNNNSGQSTVPASATNIVAIACSSSHNLALRSDGSVLGWGYNGSGQVTIPAGLSNIVAISAGTSHSLAVNAAGKVFAWGANTYGQGDASNIPVSNAVAVAGGDFHSVALLADGNVMPWGDNRYLQITVPVGLSNVTAIAAANTYSLALVTGAPQRHALLTQPARQATSFTVAIPSRSGRVYRLEYKTALTETTWTALPLVAGNGRTLTLTDPAANDALRFYRVREW
jgi:alpha-tubulin suppressor-like RCC1 family protein